MSQSDAVTGHIFASTAPASRFSDRYDPPNSALSTCGTTLLRSAKPTCFVTSSLSTDRVIPTDGTISSALAAFGCTTINKSTALATRVRM
ncbi:MAG: hypothetical protein E6K79_10670 [Candidatus Eisenbacteria bacterium]|uniref:Uncharacterized protein n=1 Tax=Eiseniibacteriota bacterium TaxID=2212470 RepID=A0A538THK2_UNCEI|nr:MAG: hypothetical protein E6K79_10670 [Candidatus Eisenbacteria bacterium]